MKLKDELSEIAADLLSYKVNEDFVARLLEEDGGKWVSVLSLCDGLVKITERIESLKQVVKESLLVSWQEYFSSSYGEGFCTITFFLEEKFWSWTAIYNKQRLLEARSKVLAMAGEIAQ